jgi:hypothetical protein
LTRTFRANIPCNLRMGQGGIAAVSTVVGAFEYYANQPQILMPVGSDIRDASCYLVEDVVECPAGSGRWYIVQGVDDVGKGFANEFRCVTVGKIYQDVAGAGTFTGLFWPFPIP